MINVDITPAKQWFKRKQWRFIISGANGEKISDRDTYSNVGDIFKVLHAVRDDEVRVRVHYAKGVETSFFTPRTPF